MARTPILSIVLKCSVLFLLFLTICQWMSCKSKEIITYKRIGGLEYVSVTSYNTKGNGQSDDRASFQKAFDRHQLIYVPRGRYALKSKSMQSAILVITEKSRVRKILFEDGAELIVHKRIDPDYSKPAVLGIFSRRGNIDHLEITNMSIDGNRDNHRLATPGIVAYEYENANIERLELHDVTIKNTGGGGIHTQALYNRFTNISTSNCGSHGIGIINTTNPHQLHEFFLDGYISTNDDAYSIDFSGAVDPKNPAKALSSDMWKGEVKNVVSSGARYGIKTAGYWDLEMDGVTIDGSRGNGFFLSKDAPGKNIILKNIIIRNAKDNGLYLAGNANFVGTNITIEDCGVLIQLEKTNCKIDGLELDGKFNNNAGIRMGSGNTEIKNFTLKNNKIGDQYAIWVQGENVILENGVFDNINGLAPIIIRKVEGDILLNNLSYLSGSRNITTTYSLMIDNDGGSVNIQNCDFINLSNIQNKRGTKINIKK